jgi:dsDNA-specific endonuclease/ATPase MutS2
MQSSSSLKKRRYRELDRCWNLVEDAADNDTLYAIKQATDDETRSAKSTSNKRSIKLNKKILSKVSLEVDLIKSQGRALPSESFKQQETVTGNFATSIYELQRDCMSSLEESDQQAIEEAASEQVDMIRFIKTNRNFYNKIVLLWLKFKTVHEDRIRLQ